MDEVTAPDLRGLGQEDARLACYERALALSIIVDDLVEVVGLDSLRACITTQQPSPGSPMSANRVIAWLGIVNDGPEVGVREPRRPPPSPRSPAGARDDGSAPSTASSD